MYYFDRQRVKALLELELPQIPTAEIVVCGWVRTRRDQGAISFVEVNDGSTVQNLQIVVPADGGFPVAKLANGASVVVKGTLRPLEGRKQKVELVPREITVVGESPDDYPMQKKRHGFEYLREIAHLRPRTNAFSVLSRFRSKMAYAIHKYYQERGYSYVTTPLISTSDCEGAGQVFKVTTFDLANVPMKDGKVDFAQDFFTEECGLSVSGQLEGEILACAIGDIYTFGPAFRAENSNTARHLSELWMVEPEMAFCELPENIQVAIDFLKFLFRYGLENCVEEMDFFDQFVAKDNRKVLEQVVAADFEILDYGDAVKIIEKAQKSRKFEFLVSWGKELQTEHERYLAEEHFKKPVVVINYPKEFKAFYMKQNDDGKTVAAMDVLVPKVGEIIGGSEREWRPDRLKAMIEEKKMADEKLWWYHDLRRFGSVPHAGFGLGFERLLMYMSGMENIRDVIPFPRTPRNCKF